MTDDLTALRERDVLWQSLDWMLWGVGIGDTFREPLADKMIAALSTEEFEKAQVLIRQWNDYRGGPHERNLYADLKAERDALRDRLERAEVKAPTGWSSEDYQESKQEAERRWSRPVTREAGQRYIAGSINGFILGAEWQKARETFISYKAITNEAIVRAERAEAAIERVRAIHRVKHGEKPRYAPDDYHAEREPVSWEPYSMCEGCSATWPCRTVAALDTGGDSNGERNDL